uniref:Uncharacterized protein n=1 Tax=Cyclopterus lumpus TaxID=8103 RepID=A0A8C3G112_CYCLU
MVEREEKSEEEEEEEDISLDSLLKRSREYVKREQAQQESNVVPTVTRTPLDHSFTVNKMYDRCIYLCKSTEETQRRALALEDMQRRLEEEHALQMSLLLDEQEREQQHLCLVSTSHHRFSILYRSRYIIFLCSTFLFYRLARIIYMFLSPGFPSPVSSNVSSGQPPVYLWGPTWAVSRPGARLSLVTTAEQQKAFCRIGAIVRGFLTRRLLKTEKVKHLRQTVMDTQEFIRSFQTEAPQKRGSCSAQDRSLQERVRAQLRAALYDIHEIFFEMPLWDRLPLLQQDRELRAERKLRDMEKAKGPKERVVLSAATQRSMYRKKRYDGKEEHSRTFRCYCFDEIQRLAVFLLCVFGTPPGSGNHRQ